MSASQSSIGKSTDSMTDGLSLAVLVESLLSRFHPVVTNRSKLDFLERLSWLLADDGSELFELRRSWLGSGDPALIELALMHWSVLLANDRQTAERLVQPLRGMPEYEALVEERLADIDRFFHADTAAHD